MPYVKAETLHRAVEGARKLRGALDGDERHATERVREALNDPAVRLWLDSWVLPGLDGLREEAKR